MKSKHLFLWAMIFIALFTLRGFSQDTLKIATYNLLNYPGTSASMRNSYFRTVLSTMNLDVLIVQEMQSQTGVDSFRNVVLNYYQPGVYNSIPFNDGPDTDNGLFYKASKVIFVRANYIPTALRDIAEYVLLPVGTSDTLRIFSLHLKAGNTSTDSLRRIDEASILRNYLNNLPTGSKFIVGGDFNIYSSFEAAFQKLVGSEVNDNGRSKDPLNAIGVWNNNFNFRYIHTQSTRTRAFGGGATGGMDDRFDMLLVSYSIDSQLISSSYTEYGNDGNHFNDSINKPPNTAVPESVANGLHYSSDHLPVFADFVVGIPVFVQSDLNPDLHFRLAQNYPNPFNSSTTIWFEIPASGFVTLKVYNVLGQEVATLVNGTLPAGRQEKTFDANNLPSGVYFYRLQAGDPSAGSGHWFIDTKKLILLK